jgi:glutathione peroxidase-family protein
MKSFLLCFLLIVVTSVVTQSAVYQYKIVSLSDAGIYINDFKDKMILVVNISSASVRGTHVLELNTLKELNSNTELAQMYFNLSSNFILAKRSKVKGLEACSLYKWLSLRSSNWIMDNEIKGDSQKILIGSNGNIISVFYGKSSPLDPLIRNSIVNKTT